MKRIAWLMVLVWMALAPMAVAEAPMENAERFEVGSVVTFGTWEQDGDASNGAEPIEWLVLKNDGETATLISQYALDAKPYNEEGISVTWETCTLRGWLNGEFYSSAFSAKEQAQIEEEQLSTFDNPKYGTDGGSDTEDHVWLLSIQEAESLLSSDEVRKCQATAYAVSEGAYASKRGIAMWWLRSSGMRANCAARVDYNGDIRPGGDEVRLNYYAVRPVVSLRLSTSEPMPVLVPDVPAEQVSEPSPVQGFSNLDVGDTVVFGHYEQDGDASNGAESIEWLVLKNDGETATLISKYALDSKPYNDELEWEDGVTWEMCTLRRWLNGEFYSSAFSAQEQAQIVETHLSNPDNPSYDVEGGNDTLDRVWLLSIQEAQILFVTDEARECDPTAYALTQMEWEEYSWWLRSPGYYNGNAAYVGSDGSIYYDGSVYDYGGAVNANYNVRPVVSLRVS